MKKTTRRKVLRGTTLATVTSLAGCGATGAPEESSSDAEDRLKEIPWPKVGSEKISGWEQTGEQQQPRGEVAGISIYSKTKIWDYQKLRTEVKEKTLGQFDQTLAQFFATSIKLDGLTTSLANEKKIMEEVVGSFKHRMRSSGVRDVSQNTSSFQNPSPNNGAITREFSGYYPTPRIEKTANIDGVGEKTVVLDKSQLPIRGFATVWKVASGKAFAAGGAHPAKDYEQMSRLSVTSEKNDGIDLLVDIDLNLNPPKIAQDLNALVESVSR